MGCESVASTVCVLAPAGLCSSSPQAQGITHACAVSRRCSWLSLGCMCKRPDNSTSRRRHNMGDASSPGSTGLDASPPTPSAPADEAAAAKSSGTGANAGAGAGAGAGVGAGAAGAGAGAGAGTALVGGLPTPPDWGTTAEYEALLSAAKAADLSDVAATGIIYLATSACAAVAAQAARGPPTHTSAFLRVCAWRLCAVRPRQARFPRVCVRPRPPPAPGYHIWCRGRHPDATGAAVLPPGYGRGGWPQQLRLCVLPPRRFLVLAQVRAVCWLCWRGVGWWSAHAGAGADAFGHVTRRRFGYIRRIYNSLTRKYKKNMQGLYVIHPTLMLKTFFTFARPFVSSKFWRKLHYVHSIDEVCAHNLAAARP